MNKQPDKLRWHPHANRYPMMAEAAFDALKADIQANGQRNFILFRMVGTEREYLDGRNRMRACQELGIEPLIERVFLPDERVEAYIDSLNEHRRHLLPEQLEKMRASRNERIKKAAKGGKSVREIAKEEQVSPSQVHRVVKPAVPNGTPERQPGDDHESEQAEREYNRKIRKINGKPVFDERRFDDLFGALRRYVDDRYASKGGRPQQLKCIEHLGAFLQEYKKWRKEQ